MTRVMERASTLSQMARNMMDNIWMAKSMAEGLILSQMGLVMTDTSNMARDMEEARLRSPQERCMKECGKKMQSTAKED